MARRVLPLCGKVGKIQIFRLYEPEYSSLYTKSSEKPLKVFRQRWDKIQFVLHSLAQGRE